MLRMPGSFSIKGGLMTRKIPKKRVIDNDGIPTKAQLSKRVPIYEDDNKRKYYRVDEKESPSWVEEFARMFPGCDFMWVSLHKSMTIRDLPIANERVTFPGGLTRMVKDVFVGKHLKDRKTGWVILTKT
jgi:hypothetical protein